MHESGISLYFRQDKIRIRYITMRDLGYPEYIHLRLNEEKKHLFIEKCARDMDSFRIEYRSGKNEKTKRAKTTSCYINAKSFLEYLASVIGVPIDSPSLRFVGVPQGEGTVFIDLNQYTVIESKKE